MVAASARTAAANATTNVTPNTPATTATLTVMGLETCDTPSEPHVNPPSGQSPRNQSIAVHAVAAPSAVSNGRPRVRTSGKSTPNRATESAVSSVNAPHASVPNSMIHDSVDPEAGESVDEAEGEASRRGRVPQGHEQERGSEEGKGPGPDGREGQRGEHAPDQGKDVRDREPVFGQAQSRQNIRRLSASWLRCLTR